MEKPTISITPNGKGDVLSSPSSCATNTTNVSSPIATDTPSRDGGAGGTGGVTHNNHSYLLQLHSYHKDPPAVHQLEDDNFASPPKHAYFGDATLAPNTGLTNSYDYALFGLALHELLDRLRLSIIINAVLLLALLFFTWWRRLFQPAHLTMSIGLAAFVFILLVVEVKSVFDATGTNSVSSTASAVVNDISGANREIFATILKRIEQIGLSILYHPLGRTMYLITCGVLCFWIGGLIEALLGLMFITNACALLYCWVTYPEFRKIFASPERNTDNNNDGSSSNNQSYSARSASWSYYSDAASTTASLVSERASLLGSVFNK
jgi:hypothetical protein